jgi:hypothetical protein
MNILAQYDPISWEKKKPSLAWSRRSTPGSPIAFVDNNKLSDLKPDTVFGSKNQTYCSKNEWDSYIQESDVRKSYIQETTLSVVFSK